MSAAVLLQILYSVAMPRPNLAVRRKSDLDKLLQGFKKAIKNLDRMVICLDDKNPRGLK